MNILSRYQFKSELFAGKFSGFNEVLPPGGTDSSTGKTLVKVRFDDEQTLDFASQINGSQLALAQIDNLIGGGDAKRSSDVMAEGIPWGTRVPYFKANPALHSSTDVVVKLYFNVHINVPHRYCFNRDVVISFYLSFLINPKTGLLRGNLDHDGFWNWLTYSGWDACRSKVEKTLNTDVMNANPQVQTLLSAAISSFAPNPVGEFYLLPGSGTRVLGSFEENATFDVTLATRPTAGPPPQR